MAEEIEIPYDPSFGAKSATRSKLCRACGGELEDSRKTYHDECKPETASTSPVGKRVKSKARKPTEATQKGMTSVAGKVLYLLTLFIAWSALRGVGVIDPTGDIADECALTDDEAEAIGRPFARMFLTTEIGKKHAPAIVANEDLIDAVFALWDWYRRMTNTLDEYRSQGNVPHAVADTPPPARFERRNGNGNNGQASPDQSEGGGESTPVYVPPSPIDLLGA
jgi:hypothetical protein